MNREGEEALRGAPDSLRELFREAETLPDWMDADNSSLASGIEMFHRNSTTFLLAFVTGVLLEGFTTNIAKSFHITGRVRDQGLRRLENNNRHMMDIFFPGGLQRDRRRLEAVRPHSHCPGGECAALQSVDHKSDGRFTESCGPSSSSIPSSWRILRLGGLRSVLPSGLVVNPDGDLDPHGSVYAPGGIQRPLPAGRGC